MSVCKLRSLNHKEVADSFIYIENSFTILAAHPWKQQFDRKIKIIRTITNYYVFTKERKLPISI